MIYIPKQQLIDKLNNLYLNNMDSKHKEMLDVVLKVVNGIHGLNDEYCGEDNMFIK